MKNYPESTPAITTVSEALTTYVTEQNFLQNFTQQLSLSSFFENKLLVIQTIRKGIPFKLFEQLRKLSPFTDSDWAEFLDISLKTIQRHKNEPNYVFKSIHSEKILELTEVTQFGEQVFQDSAQFNDWLHTSNYTLGGMKPIELLKDSYGKELVLDELNRIDHGIFA